MSALNPVKHIPNTLTLINLLLGCFSIVSSFEGNAMLAGYLILLASVFDFFDGFAARLLKAYSPLGKDLDSLSDLVSFGVAPSVILFHLLRNAMAASPDNGLTSGNIILAIPFLVAAFSALRLAKFNNDTRQTNSFIGLPTPANAIFIVGLVFGLNSPSKALFEPIAATPIGIIATTILFSALLVSPIPMFSLKIKRGFRARETWKQQILLFISVGTASVLGKAALSIVILYYIALSAITWVFERKSISKQ